MGIPRRSDGGEERRAKRSGACLTIPLDGALAYAAGWRRSPPRSTTRLEREDWFRAYDRAQMEDL